VSYHYYYDNSSTVARQYTADRKSPVWHFLCLAAERTFSQKPLSLPLTADLQWCIFPHW